jgi:hypothetical protein
MGYSQLGIVRILQVSFFRVCLGSLNKYLALLKLQTKENLQSQI